MARAKQKFKKAIVANINHQRKIIWSVLIIHFYLHVIKFGESPKFTE